MDSNIEMLELRELNQSGKMIHTNDGKVIVEQGQEEDTEQQQETSQPPAPEAVITATSEATYYAWADAYWLPGLGEILAEVLGAVIQAVIST